MTEGKFVKEREMLLADFFESIVPEEHYPTALKKLIEIYGNDVMEGIALDIGFDTAPEIEGPTDVQNSGTAHDQMSAETLSEAQAAERSDGEYVEEVVMEVDSDNEASASIPDLERKKKEKHIDEL